MIMGANDLVPLSGLTYAAIVFTYKMHELAVIVLCQCPSSLFMCGIHNKD